MHRATIAFVAVLVASFTSGCGRYYYRHRVAYVMPEPEPVMVAVRPVYAPPPPPVAPPPVAPRRIVVHAPPGSVVIVKPGRAPVVRQQVPVAPVVPAAPEIEPEAPAAPEAPSAPVETDESWFNGG